MSRRKKIMVAVSAIALRALTPLSAGAQVLISCTAMNFGRQVACGTSGVYQFRPSGTTSLKSGCLISFIPAQPAKCVLSTGGTPPAKDVKVTFATTSITGAGPGDTVKVTRLRMAPDGSNTEKQFLKFTPTEISNTVTVNIGGRLNFKSSQVVGSYTANFVVNAN